jgi:hypothetical protein
MEEQNSDRLVAVWKARYTAEKRTNEALHQVIVEMAETYHALKVVYAKQINRTETKE